MENDIFSKNKNIIEILINNPKLDYEIDLNRDLYN
jgi:hypothetical protein